MRLGFVGAGRMGRPMVRRLAAAGHPVRVLARSPLARQDLAAQWHEVADDLAGVAAGVEAVMVCVLTDAQVREVVPGLLGHMAPRSTLVVHTTVSPRTISSIVDEAGPRGIDVVDAPVSGGPHDVAAGRITLFVGGAAEPVARMRPVLASYGDPILHVGGSGAGQRVKLLNNALFAAQLGLALDAARLATGWGVDEAVLLDALTHGSAASRAVSGAVTRGSVATFVRSIADFLTKDLDVLRADATDLGSIDVALRALNDTLSPVETGPRQPAD
jgi:3-hydroxyisobutyrate dehydrogenase-like beta-hydroxyacid dehydrogenase